MPSRLVDEQGVQRHELAAEVDLVAFPKNLPPKKRLGCDRVQIHVATEIPSLVVRAVRFDACHARQQTTDAVLDAETSFCASLLGRLAAWDGRDRL